MFFYLLCLAIHHFDLGCYLALHLAVLGLYMSPKIVLFAFETTFFGYCVFVFGLALVNCAGVVFHLFCNALFIKKAA